MGLTREQGFHVLRHPSPHTNRTLAAEVAETGADPRMA
jgi:hypothetical protein